MSDDENKTELPRDKGPLRLVDPDVAIIPKRPWERLPKETKIQYAAFKAFIALDPARRSVFEASIAGGANLGPYKLKHRQPPTRWSKWSRDNQWHARATSWDAYVDELELEERRKALEDSAGVWADRRRDQRDKEWDVSQDLVRKAQDMLAWPLEEVVTVDKYEDGREKTIIIRPTKWNLRDAAAFIETADKLARLAAEMATDRSKDRDESEAEAVNERAVLRRILQDSDAMRAAELLTNKAKDARASSKKDT